MGQEVSTSRFDIHDFSRFRDRLAAELELLRDHFYHQRFSRRGPVAGFELEAWLVDQAMRPAPRNEEFLKRLNDPNVVHELAEFNIELNVAPQRLNGNALTALDGELKAVWDRCEHAAADMGLNIMAIGILPTVEDRDLTLEHMSLSARYRSLNEQVLYYRQGRPLVLDIHGADALQTTHYDVMLESIATSFQLHLQVAESLSVSAFNASLALCGPLVAVSANSPYIFGRDLWDESRIPLFEQAVALGHRGHRRVSFGTGYAQGSLLSCFESNIDHFPILIPESFQEDDARFAHTRLHNGTIWRWVRPLIGFDPDGTPHLRVEQRVIPAGPTRADSLANAAFYWGAVHALMSDGADIEQVVDFSQARRNFYSAARHGLSAYMEWRGSARDSVRELVLEELLPLARRGLADLNVEPESADRCLGIIEARVGSGQNGAVWQRAWVGRHGADLPGLCRAYHERQRHNVPVHEWDL